MKHNVNPDTIGQQAEFDAAVSFQDKPLTIAGPADYIVELHSEAESHVRTARISRLSKPVAQVAIEPVKTAVEVLDGRRATVAAKVYDVLHKTTMYEALKQKREDERNLQMATRLGLISLEDVSCRKHQTAIAKLHNL